MKFSYPVLILICSLFVISCGHSRHASSNGAFGKKQLCEDYDLMQQVLVAKHPSLYWYTAKDSMDFYFRFYKSLIQDSMTEEAFNWQVLSPLLNKTHCGHTSVTKTKKQIRVSKKIRFPSFPLELKVWNDTMAVVGNLNERDSIFKRGTIVKSINGVEAKTIIATMLDRLSEDGYSHNVNYIRISSNFPRIHQYVYGLSKAYQVNYLDSSGNLLSAVLPLFIPGKDSSARDTVTKKVTVKTPKVKKINNYRSLQIDSSGRYAVMRLNTFSSGHLRHFFRHSFRTIRKRHVPNLIIDIRTNGGGNVSTSTLFTKYIASAPFKVADTVFTRSNNLKPYTKYFKSKWLNDIGFAMVTRKRADGQYHLARYERKYFKPKKKNHFKGKSYVLINGPTFSASCLFTNAVKGQKNVVVVGEESGGGWYGNNGIFIPEVKLPNTHIRVRMPLFRVVQYRHDEQNKGKGILPDIYIPTSYEALKKGYDMKMKVVKQLIAEDVKVSQSN